MGIKLRLPNHLFSECSSLPLSNGFIVAFSC
jgi:hypothetical protein